MGSFVFFFLFFLLEQPSNTYRRTHTHVYLIFFIKSSSIITDTQIGVEAVLLTPIYSHGH